jgi:RNA polymerase sigma-70 factor (ECF subfamily)
MVEEDAMTSDENEAGRKALVAALVRVAAGDRGALQFIYKQTAAKLFGVCLRILPDKVEAEDVVQEVYVTVWRRADTFDPDRGSPIAWLAAIARNRAIDRLRGGTRRMKPLEDAAEIVDMAPSALSTVITDETHRRLMACIDGLDVRDASAIRETFLDGATYEKLASRLSIPLGTIKSRIRRSLIQLRECLGDA